MIMGARMNRTPVKVFIIYQIWNSARDSAYGAPRKHKIQY